MPAGIVREYCQRREKMNRSMIRSFFVFVFAFVLICSLPLLNCAGSPSPQDPSHYFRLSERYFNEQNYTQAVFWWRKAAEQGEAQSQNNLGVFYAQGLGVERDFAQALYWFKKAAEQGYPGAINNVNYLNRLGYY